MKTWVILGILFLICISSVIAGNTYKLDFSESDKYVVGMGVGDRAEFKLNDQVHSLTLSGIREDAVDISLFLDLEELDEKEVPFYGTIGMGKVLKLDLEKDRIDDLFVGVYRIQGDKAQLVFQLPEINENQITGAVIFDSNARFNRNYDWLVISILGLVIICFITVIVLKKRNK